MRQQRLFHRVAATLAVIGGFLATLAGTTLEATVHPLAPLLPDAAAWDEHTAAGLSFSAPPDLEVVDVDGVLFERRRAVEALFGLRFPGGPTSVVHPAPADVDAELEVRAHAGPADVWLDPDAVIREDGGETEVVACSPARPDGRRWCVRERGLSREQAAALVVVARSLAPADE